MVNYNEDDSSEEETRWRIREDAIGLSSMVANLHIYCKEQISFIKKKKNK